MHGNTSTPDGISTADLILERACVEMEQQVERVRDEIGRSQNPAMLLGALCTLDTVREGLDSLQKQAETKLHGLAFAAELFVA